MGRTKQVEIALALEVNEIAEFYTYVENRNFLKIGDYIDLIYFDSVVRNNKSWPAEILEITEIVDVDKSDFFRIRGVAKYLNNLRAKMNNRKLKYHAREVN